MILLDGNPWGPPFSTDPSDVFHNAAQSVNKAVAYVAAQMATWWVTTKSPDLTKEHTITVMQAWLLPVTVTVALVAIFISAGKLILTRKGAPLIDVGTGLVAILATTGGTLALAVALPNLLLQLGDEFSSWILDKAANGDFAKGLSRIMGCPALSDILVLILSFIALLVSLIQAALLVFRQASVIILAGVMPLAACGMLTTSTRMWMRKIAGWMLSLIFYKPMAAMVYVTMFTLVGQGKDLESYLMAMAMMLISLVAFPVLLRFFDWTTGGSETHSGGALLTAAIGGATAIGALRNFVPGTTAATNAHRASDPIDQSAVISQNLGSPEKPNPHRPQQQPAPPQANDGPDTTSQPEQTRRAPEVKWLNNPTGAAETPNHPTGSAHE